MISIIAHKQGPEYVVYDRKELRLHLKECFDKGYIEPFPTSKKRRLKNCMLMEEVCLIYCVCRLPETRWIQDDAMRWLYGMVPSKVLNSLSVPLEEMELDTWLCEKCRQCK